MFGFFFNFFNVWCGLIDEKEKVLLSVGNVVYLVFDFGSDMKLIFMIFIIYKDY